MSLRNDAAMPLPTGTFARPEGLPARPVRDAADTAWALPRSLLNTPLESRHAESVAVAVGSLVGAGMGTLAGLVNPAAPVATGAGVGVVLAGLYVQGARLFQRWDEAHRQRWQILQQFQSTRDYMAAKGIGEHDEEAVQRFHDRLHDQLQQLMGNFRKHCRMLGMPCTSRVEYLVEYFFLAYCGEKAPCVTTNIQERCWYIGAIKRQRYEAVRQAVERDREHPSRIFSRERAVYMVIDPDGGADQAPRVQLRGLARSETPRLPGQARAPSVAAAATAAPTAGVQPPAHVAPPSTRHDIVPLVQVRRRAARAPTADPPAARSAAMAPASASMARHRIVVQGPLLRQQYADLPADSRSRADLERISDDLAAGRSVGHTVSIDGRTFIASDIHLQGLSGRNRWRLLYRPTADGYELHGIADYHGGPARATVWWRG